MSLDQGNKMLLPMKSLSSSRNGITINPKLIIMPKKNVSCKKINAMVKEYYTILQTTIVHSPERLEAGIVHEKLLACFEKFSHQKIDLNKLVPQILHFLNSKNLKLRTKRAESMNKPVKRK